MFAVEVILTAWYKARMATTDFFPDPTASLGWSFLSALHHPAATRGDQTSAADAWLAGFPQPSFSSRWISPRVQHTSYVPLKNGRAAAQAEGGKGNQNFLWSADSCGLLRYCLPLVPTEIWACVVEGGMLGRAPVALLFQLPATPEEQNQEYCVINASLLEVFCWGGSTEVCSLQPACRSLLMPPARSWAETTAATPWSQLLQPAQLRAQGQCFLRHGVHREETRASKDVKIKQSP